MTMTMKQMISGLVGVAAAAIMAVGIGAAQANVLPAVLGTNDDCSTADVQYSDDCIGSVYDPNNDFSAHGGANPHASAVNEYDFFGYDDWVLADRDDDGSGFIDLGLDGELGGTDGDWSITGDLSMYDEFILVFKAGDAWVAYYFDDTSLTGGEWDLTGWTSNALSHLSLYVRGSATLPEPAVLGLLGLGLIGVGAARRRRKRA